MSKPKEMAVNWVRRQGRETTTTTLIWVCSIEAPTPILGRDSDKEIPGRFFLISDVDSTFIKANEIMDLAFKFVEDLFKP